MPSPVVLPQSKVDADCSLGARVQTEQEKKKAQLPGGFPAWSPSRIRMLIGVSGVYNCFDLADHFNRCAQTYGTHPLPSSDPEAVPCALVGMNRMQDPIWAACLPLDALHPCPATGGACTGGFSPASCLSMASRR